MSDAADSEAEDAAPSETEDAAADQHFVRHTHEGMHYLNLIAAIHQRLEPATYLEVGSDEGESLRMANCTSIAIDPRFKISQDVIGSKPALHLFQETSDSFFRSEMTPKLFPHGVDLAFLDGLHLFEYLLRDFIYIEKLSHWRSVVLLHDCLPPNVEIAERDYRPDLRKDPVWQIYWTGDVWKLVPILQAYRPDLRLTLFDASPSGLVMVTGLDAGNRVLEQKYAEIIKHYRDMVLDDALFLEFYSKMEITPSAGLDDSIRISGFL